MRGILRAIRPSALEAFLYYFAPLIGAYIGIKHQYRLLDRKRARRLSEQAGE